MLIAHVPHGVAWRAHGRVAQPVLLLLAVVVLVVCRGDRPHRGALERLGPQSKPRSWSGVPSISILYLDLDL